MMEDTCEVHFGGHVEEIELNGKKKYVTQDYYTVEAVPYDMPVVGYDATIVNPLRMWSARSPKKIDLSSFGEGRYVQASEEIELAEAISKVLYPEDRHYEGKMLRLKQHYFFTSASQRHEQAAGQGGHSYQRYASRHGDSGTDASADRRGRSGLG